MLTPLQNRTYRNLFFAQVIALIGTGVATVGLGLLAFAISGDDAGIVLGIALAIKMVAYIVIAPIATALAVLLPRKTMLIALDLVRVIVALLLPFVTQVFEIYFLIFLLQAASAAFTPTFQAIIPEVLPSEKDYTKALSLSRLAYDLESLISPILVATLLTVMEFNKLFIVTGLGFFISALLVASVVLPSHKTEHHLSFYERTFVGLKIYFSTPRLRGLLAVNMALASAGSMVFVNSVILVKLNFQLNNNALTIALASFGVGSILAALSLPYLLEKVKDRNLIIMSIILMIAGLFFGYQMKEFPHMLFIWFLLGIGFSAAQTPSGRLLRQSSHQDNRSSLFAAQFALSHLCWLIFYPLTGWLGAHFEIKIVFVILGSLSFISLCFMLILWPSQDPKIIKHKHDNLHQRHPHLEELLANDESKTHSHVYIIDNEHPKWPKKNQ